MKPFGRLLSGAFHSSSKYAGFPAKCLESVPCFDNGDRPVYGPVQRVFRQIEERIALVVGPRVEELHGFTYRCDLPPREVGLLNPYGRCQFHQIQRRGAGQVALGRAT